MFNFNFRHYVMRLIFVEQPVPQAVIASWCSKLHAEEHEHVVRVLHELNVWRETAIPGGMPGWILNSTFKKHLKIALLGGGRSWTMSNQLETDSKPRDVAFLDSYALERWECVLHYLAGSQQQEGKNTRCCISQNFILLFLKHSKFVVNIPETLIAIY